MVTVAAKDKVVSMKNGGETDEQEDVVEQGYRVLVDVQLLGLHKGHDGAEQHNGV